MAHECPECGSICYCGGDIDDCELNEPRFVDTCIHCDPSLADEDEPLSPVEQAAAEIMRGHELCYGLPMSTDEAMAHARMIIEEEKG